MNTHMNIFTAVKSLNFNMSVEIRQLSERDVWDPAVTSVALGKTTHHIRKRNPLCILRSAVISPVIVTPSNTWKFNFKLCILLS